MEELYEGHGIGCAVASVEVTAARNAPVVFWGPFKQREIENGEYDSLT
jgi:hypothetical protein